jgi:hypothetical protein
MPPVARFASRRMARATDLEPALACETPATRCLPLGLSPVGAGISATKWDGGISFCFDLSPACSSFSNSPTVGTARLRASPASALCRRQLGQAWERPQIELFLMERC